MRWDDALGRERSKSFARKKDAQDFMAQTEVDLRTGAYIDPQHLRLTFGEYASKHMAASDWRPASRKTYASYMREHILPRFARAPLGSVRTSDVKAFIRELEAKGLAYNTVASIHKVVSGTFKAAVQDRYLASTPCVGTAPKRPDKAKIIPLTVDQVEGLLAVTDPRYYAMVAVGAGCGLRIGETLGLRVPRLLFLKQTIEVRQQLVHVSPTPPTLAPLKTRSSTRDVPMPSLVTEALSEHLRAFPVVGSDLVFRSRMDTPVFPGTFRDNPWKRMVRDAALPKGTRFHDLRHFYASALIANGQSVLVVQSMLGHSSATETLDLYGHLFPDAEGNARTAMDATFNRRPAGLRLTR